MKKLVRRRAKNIVGAFVSGIGFIGFGLIVLLMSDKVGIDVDVQNAEDISYLSMEKDNVYWFDELTVVDSYATLNDGDVNYFIVSYEDMNGKTVLASLSLNPEEDPWDATERYLENDEAGVGDCVLKGYFELKEDASDNADKRRLLFNDGVSRNKQNDAIPIFATSLKDVLRYKCATYDELVSLSNATNAVSKYMGIFSLALGFLAIYDGFRWISINKKLDAREAAAKAEKPSMLDDIVNNSGFFTHPTVRKVSPAQPEAPPKPAAPVAPASDKMAKLNEYKALVDAGYMTREEFEQKRKEILQIT
jgi:hypothetical protein